VPERAVLVPTAHDEPALTLTAYKPVFHAPRAIAYNTVEERELVRRRFRNERVPGAVVGVGVDLPADQSAARFRAAHGIEGPILLYVGRVGESKGAPELFRYFTRWSDERRNGNATLVVIGHAEMPIPKRADVVHLGYASDETKFDAYAACDALIVPERYSSLSMVTLESWASGRPVICSAYCNVLAGMSLRSEAGLAYGSYAEFAEICDLLVDQHDLGDRLGARGREFVESTYTWPRVVETYRDLFAEVRARNA
jgi:glycosyltransferase involved in cell wall biosynthesis